VKKIKELFFKNVDLIIYAIVSVFIELFAITYTTCGFYLSRPFYPLLVLVFFTGLLSLIKNKIWRLVSIVFLLGVQLVLDVSFIFLYDSNGTVFEWAMFNQRTDAFGTLETFDLQYGYILICLLVIFVPVFILGKKLYKSYKNKEVIKNEYGVKYFIADLCVMLFCLVTVILIPILETNEGKKTIYTDRLYSETANNYQSIGMVSNGIYQIISGKTVVNINDVSDVDDFIYEEKILKSDYYGVSKGNNLVLILIESGEWYPFTMYPELSEKLYPNLTRFMKEGLIASSFYQKEKTDVSEAFSVLGNYPTGKYVNYDFADNSYPFALPNLLRHYNSNMVIKSYHANYGSFYNRYDLHKAWGFENLVGIDEMEEYGVVDTWQHKMGERNLDSITFDKMKEEMFPKDKSFFSFILSFTMHGYYGKRETLEPYYEILDQYGVIPDISDENDEYLKTYMAALMDFDKAVGSMMDYLEETNRLDDTTIVMFSDHNTYYNSLSYYAKDIEEKYNSELYHIPMMIYDRKLTEKYVSETGSNKIEKFTTTSDIVPTILDVFGLDGWKNLYFGNSVFIPDKESIVFSRNYGIFISDKFVGYSLNALKYKDESTTKEELKDFEERALIHLKKLEFTDKIYYSNYFKDNEYRYE
jgi:phosphoglycerol transferase MdoB-like AlkP superfamily enzyme